MAPKKKPGGKTGGALCHCGRPLGHTGRHIGSPAKAAGETGRSKRSRFGVAVESQIKRCHDTIARLRADMREREAELRRAEAELKPLVALHEVYRDLALPAPAAAAAVAPTVVTGLPAVQAPRPALPSTSAADDAVEADMPTVMSWAAQRGITCKSWEDLPAINNKREQLGMAPFKRKFPTRGSYARTA